MIRFLDGPAADSVLSLGRAPFFLRVVIDTDGAVDALDQLDDTVRESETPHAYVLVGGVGRAIACSRGRGGGCRPSAVAKYRHYENQPAEEVLRDNARWQEWATNEGNSIRQ